MTTNTQQKEEGPPTLKNDSACSKTDPTDPTPNVASCLKRNRTAEFPLASQPKFAIFKKIRSDGDICFDSRPIEKLDIDFKKLEFSKKIEEEPTQNTKVTTTTTKTTSKTVTTSQSSNDSSTNTNITFTTTNNQTTQTVQYHSSQESSVLTSSGTGSYESAGSSNDPKNELPDRPSFDDLEVNSDVSPVQLSETDSSEGENEEFSLQQPQSVTEGSTATKKETVTEKEKKSS